MKAISRNLTERFTIVLKQPPALLSACPNPVIDLKKAEIKQI